MTVLIVLPSNKEGTKMAQRVKDFLLGLNHDYMWVQGPSDTPKEARALIGEFLRASENCDAFFWDPALAGSWKIGKRVDEILRDFHLPLMNLLSLFLMEAANGKD